MATFPSPTYIAADQFKVDGDYVDREGGFDVARAVRCDCGPDGIKYGAVASASYNGTQNETTVTLFGFSDNLTSNLKEVITSPVRPGSKGNFMGPLKLPARALASTAVGGALEYDGDALYFTERGQQRPITLANDTRTSDLTVADTTNETEIHSSSVIADELRAGQMYRVTLLGKFSTASSSDFFTLRFKVGGTTVLTGQMTAKNVADAHFHAIFTLTIRSSGGSGSYAAQMEAQLGEETLDITPTTDTVDTTVAEDITCTVQWDAAAAGNTLTVMQSLLEIMD